VVRGWTVVVFVWFMVFSMDLSKLSVEQLRAYAVRLDALRSPASMARSLDSRYRVKSHHRVIGDALAGLNQPGGRRKLMIFAPPRAGKSELVTKYLPLWWLSHHPDHHVVAASYSTDLAKKSGRDVRRLVREHGPRVGLELSPDVRTAQAWQLVSGGGMRTTGVGAGLTGHNADLLICDDPHKTREEAESKSQRDRVDDWWSSTFITRQSPGTPVCMILTRWHEDDIAGRLLEREGDEWQVIRLPAFADSGDDPLGRVLGEPLPHPKIPDDVGELTEFWNSMRRSVSLRDWHSMYMCDPQPVEGTLLSEEYMQASRWPAGEKTPEALRVGLAVDPSGVQGGDECGIVLGFASDDGRCFITADHTGQYSPTEWGREVALMAYEAAVDVIFVETNFGGEMNAAMIRSGWQYMEDQGLIPEGFLIPKIEEVRAKYGKRIRAEPVAQKWTQGQVRLVGDHPELEKQWTTWQLGSRESPGHIDACVYLVQGLIGNRVFEKPGIVEPPIGESLLDDYGDWETEELW
jgi:hypothetical protein